MNNWIFLTYEGVRYEFTSDATSYEDVRPDAAAFFGLTLERFADFETTINKAACFYMYA